MATLRDIGEFGFIDRIRELVGEPGPGVIRGIGDDCAVMDVGRRDKLLVTVDGALEGRHFRLDWISPYDAARRSTAGAISDIAAMGGVPFATFCTAAIPADTRTEHATDLMRGVAETARKYGAPLVGGDIVGAFDSIMIDLVVLGWAEQPWVRSGARPGDTLAITGCLGESAAAVNLLSCNPALLDEPDFTVLRKRFTDPTPRVAEARVLAGDPAVHAAIDISDGLVQDAGHIARESGVRMEIIAASIPVDPSCAAAGARLSHRPQWSPATSGEEYELLLSLAPGEIGRVNEILAENGLGALTPVGRVIEGEGVALLGKDGEELSLETRGWDHFRAER
ncbi:MAG: thiamine-phosphate kinase [Armatimonadetes bacterium]|nr:thiamine-phosphate kinase [Armatimonadota bacterium]